MRFVVEEEEFVVVVGWLSEGYWIGRRCFFIFFFGIGEYGWNEIIFVGVVEIF